MIRRTALGLSILLSSMGGAWAVPATPEEAQRLTAVLERFVGHGMAGKPGPITVAPHGEGYTATLDVTRMLGFTAAAGIDVKAGDVTAELTPQADGTWHVTLGSLPPFGVTQDGHTFAMSLDGYTLDGIFDPRIKAFSSTRTTSHGVTTRLRGGDDAVDTILTHTGHGIATATDAGNGTIDARGATTLADVAYAVTVGSGLTEGAVPRRAIGVRAATVETTSTWDHQPAGAMLDLWQFLVAHPSKATLVAAQADLKIRLKALLPLGTAFSSSAAAKVVAIDTPLGGFGFEQAASSTAVPDGPGPIMTRVAVGGLVIPAGLAPAWAVPLVPTAIDLTENQGRLDVSRALNLAIDDIDLSNVKPLTPEQVTAITAALGGDTTTLTIAPSTIVTPSMTIKLTGETRMTKPLPTGHAEVSAVGLDKAIAAVRLAAADDPASEQAIAMLMAAKALGKAEGADSYSWAIASTPAGDITVNGASLGSIGGPAPPAPKARKKPLAP